MVETTADRVAREKQEWLSFFNALSDEQQKVVRNHLQLSGEMRMWCDLRSHLANEFHIKKMTKKRKYYHCEDKEVDKAYNLLYLKRKEFGTLSTFPCSFQHGLENVMWKEIQACRIDRKQEHP